MYFSYVLISRVGILRLQKLSLFYSLVWEGSSHPLYWRINGIYAKHIGYISYTYPLIIQIFEGSISLFIRFLRCDICFRFNLLKSDSDSNKNFALESTSNLCDLPFKHKVIKYYSGSGLISNKSTMS